MKRLEDLSDSIVQDFVHMRKQEEEMRDTNGMQKQKTISTEFLITISSLLRINQQSCAILQHLQYVLSIGIGYMAGALS